MDNKIKTTINLVDDLIEVVDNTPSYGLMAFSTPMVNYIMPDCSNIVKDLFHELEEMLKVIEQDHELSTECIRCKNHDLYYDFTYQKLNKVKKELKQIKEFLLSI